MVASSSSLVFMVHRLKRMVESKRLFFTPIAFSVPESAGLLDEQAEPDDTYIPLSSSACRRTSLLTSSKLMLMTCGVPSCPLLPLKVVPGISPGGRLL